MATRKSLIFVTISTLILGSEVGGFPTTLLLPENNTNSGLIVAIKPLESSNKPVNERGNLATFIQWAVLPPNAEFVTATTLPPTTVTTEVEPEVEYEEVTEEATIATLATTTTELATTATTTGLPPPPESTVEAVTITPSAIESLILDVVQTGQKNTDTDDAASIISTSDNKAVPQAIYVVRQPATGSIVGILGEALNLAQVAIRVIGVNLLGAPLYGAQGANGQYVLLNSTRLIGERNGMTSVVDKTSKM